MAQQTINIGATANDGTGDSLRDAGDKINDNFTELYGDKQPLDDQLTALAALSGADGSFVRWTGTATAVMQAILGTASQSAGVPTGALFEYSSNSDGHCIRFPDGTQICWGEKAATDSITNAFQGGYRSAGKVVTWPKAFSANPFNLAIGTDLNSFSVVGAGAGTTSGSFVFTSVSSDASSISRVFNWLAIGRWF